MNKKLLLTFGFLSFMVIGSVQAGFCAAQEMPFFRDSSIGQGLASGQVQSTTYINPQSPSLNIPSGTRIVPIDPSKLNMASLPPGAYIKRIPLSAPNASSVSLHHPLQTQAQAPKTIVLSEEMRSYLFQTIESAVGRALLRRGIQ